MLGKVSYREAIYKALNFARCASTTILGLDDCGPVNHIDLVPDRHSAVFGTICGRSKNGYAGYSFDHSKCAV